MNRRTTDASSSGTNYVDILKRLFRVEVDGRPLVELFREVPSPEEYTDYRDYVDTPISLAEIVKRARLDAYDSDDDFIADFELMAENARAYNGDNNPVYDDALDILDFALASIHRPVNKVTKMRQQEKVLNDLESYKYRGRRLSEQFLVEPDRNEYPDYYKVISNPTSFSKVRKILEKNGPYDSWDDVRKLIEPIFTNAMEYNRENSQTYLDAQTLLKQLQVKMDKNRRLPPHLESALSSGPNKVRLKLGAQSATKPASSGSGSDEGSDDGDQSDEEEDLAPQRFADDDDESDFEADSDEEDDDDEVPDPDADEDESDDLLGSGEDDGFENGLEPGTPGPPAIQQPKYVYDELVYREPGQTSRDGMIQLVTVQTFAPAPPVTPSTPMPLRQRAPLRPAQTDITQIRITAPQKETFTTLSTTLPSYHSSVKVNVILNQNLRAVPHQLTVVLNGQKMLPINRGPPPLPGAPPQLLEEYELQLGIGLNQVTIIAIKVNSAGFIRMAGPPPVVGAEPDEERMVLFLNLTK